MGSSERFDLIVKMKMCSSIDMCCVMTVEEADEINSLCFVCIICIEC